MRQSQDHSGLPRGIDHVGVTVPDMEAALLFLVKAFGAVPLYRNVTPDHPQEGAKVEKILDLVPGTVVKKICMVALGHGPCIELFEMHGPEQRSAVRPCDFGLQHFAVYVDDIEAACARFRAAGGVLMTEPQKQPTLEEAPGNLLCYGKTTRRMIPELPATSDRERPDAVSPEKPYQPPLRAPEKAER